MKGFCCLVFVRSTFVGVAVVSVVCGSHVGLLFVVVLVVDCKGSLVVVVTCNTKVVEVCNMVDFLKLIAVVVVVVVNIFVGVVAVLV